MSVLLLLAAAAAEALPANGYVPPKVAAPPPRFPPVVAGAAFTDCRDCPEMVVIAPGTFVMGSSAQERKALGVLAMFDRMEEPRHRVTIGYRFAVARYSVTFDEWDACVADGGCNGYRPDDAGWGRGRRPVINVNFADAQGYVAWLSKRTGQRYRLLSEAEWEYAGRGGTETWYPFGNFIDATKANYGNHHDRTTPVGSYPPNGFGLHDMTANVAQWVQDCHHDDYVGAPTDGSAWLSGPCTLRNVRGGGWSLSGWSVRVAQRIGDPPGARNDHLGFRVARDMPQD
ncbi:formylglycine-generating enzyme family protein [Novosphingobium taihuense]|uniref:Formylglycine-generating enzyme required for sulfatase activity n=1 Tax=Novosphingobium taihuense TaxID=260085 RepID=A0A7W7AEV7_9SPHN|nr:formylglycine-generating enzyme family protein [Novosphingobium taihuense]MBB4614817.1 formylglycine-generating enzyme required for sulfatase activity [Novosphingobium taihuense]TWH84741.1 formylglycine-generating enzyme required for sulfatase activity [Novosphingobium taihuense]